MKAANDDFRAPIPQGVRPEVSGARSGGWRIALTEWAADMWRGLEFWNIPFIAGLSLIMWAIIELERWLN